MVTHVFTPIMKRHLLVLAVVVAVVSPLSANAVLVGAASLETEHIVREGETLSAIARQHGATVAQIVQLNHLKSADALTAGQVLKLPARAPQAPTASPSPVPASAGTEYVVKTGDTLGGIAAAHGITPQALAEANALVDPDRLQVGQKLKIPRSSSVPNTPEAIGQPSTAEADTEAGALFERLAKAYSTDAALLKALAWFDSSGKPVSLTGQRPLGLLALSENTFDYVAESIIRRPMSRSNTTDMAEAGTAYLAWLMHVQRDETRALAIFIQGPGSVERDGVKPTTTQQIEKIGQIRAELRKSQPADASLSLRTVVSTGAEASAAASGSLEDQVMAAARRVAGPTAKIGVAAHDQVSGRRVSINGSQPFASASVGKLLIMTELFRQADLGLRSLTDPLRDDVRKMVVFSDNDSANRLMDLLGAKTINSGAAARGLTASRVVNHFGSQSTGSGEYNQSTPNDMLRLLELLATDQLASSAASKEMRALLLKATDATKIRQGLPIDATLAHKSGWFESVANDVGIVYHPRGSYVLSVFTEGVNDPTRANETIAAIARTIHKAWAGG